ncbi:amidase [Paenibacillus caui]|uniref:amidase n=1 Tax=Paenibacillus caui TaxID=2873927 RepID=UPI001CAA3735|nr:amidase [Paenibacillus caui]
MQSDKWNAFIEEDLSVEPSGTGFLEGLTFAVKDVIAIKGHTNSAGNPDWLRTHEPAEATAAVVEALLAQGARLQGMAHTDELMFSLNGENFHYGTPVNPKDPKRIPGGSSSGSAVAVAAGMVDFALGTDTGGSIRIPSSYCGLYGFRPTHGLIPTEGVIPLARSFDTVGLMARDPKTLRQVGDALKAWKSGKGTGTFKRIHFASDAWDTLEPGSRGTLLGAVPVIESLLGKGNWMTLADKGLPEWFQAFRTIQGYEIWAEHGEWIEKEHPVFGPDIAERFAWTKTIPQEDFERKKAVRKQITSYMEELLGDDGLLIIPTAPCQAPQLGLVSEQIEHTRARVMQLSCIAGLTGFPQVTVPFAEPDGLPIGLSFIAGRGLDGELLAWIHETLAPALVEAAKSA